VAIGALLLYTTPWLVLFLAVGKVVWLPSSLLTWGAIALSLTTITLHYWLRRQIAVACGIPPRYWWLTGVGGVLVAAIAIASVIKTETGWGWTWRGRALMMSEE